MISPAPKESHAAVRQKKEAGTEYSVDSLAGEIEATIRCLCKRVQEEQRPEDCRTLMECVRIGMEALRALYD